LLVDTFNIGDHQLVGTTAVEESSVTPGRLVVFGALQYGKEGKDEDWEGKGDQPQGRQSYVTPTTSSS
jgi:hypothetical protein